MLKYLYSFSFFVIIISCNYNHKQTNLQMNINKNSNTLEDRANDFYKKKMFLEAKLSYDTLISIDSAKGEYYYKRGNCESMISDSKTNAIIDFFKAINHNYSEKQKAYLNIGTIHRFNAVFRCKTDHDRISEYDTALYFYNESLKVEPHYAKALKEKEEVIENLKRISF